MNNDNRSFFESSLQQSPRIENMGKDNSNDDISSKKSFFDEAIVETPREERQMPWYQSFANSAMKGLAKGARSTLELFNQQISEDPFGDQGNRFGQVLGVDIMPEDFKKMKKETEQGFALSEDERQKFKQDLEREYPSNDSFIEGSLEKGLELGVPSLLGQGSALGKVLRPAIGGIVQQQAENMGVGETGQNLIGIASMATPAMRSRIEAATPRQQQLLDFGRRMGMSETEMAPLMHENNWLTRTVARFAKKTGKTHTTPIIVIDVTNG